MKKKKAGALKLLLLYDPGILRSGCFCDFSFKYQ